VAETGSHNLGKLNFRASLPRYVRYASVAGLAVTIVVLGVAFYRGSRDPQFRMQGFPAALSKDVVASVNGYERTEFDNGVAKYYVKADKATTFTDNHQELENAFFEIFNASGSGSDKIKAEKAVYVPEADKNFTAFLAGSVSVETRDRLKVQTEQITYKKITEIALAEEGVAFQHENISGESFGAELNIAEKKIDLLRDVVINQFESVELSGEPTVIMNAGNASYEQAAERIHLNGDIKVHSVSKVPSRVTDMSAGSAVVSLSASAGNNRDIRSAELFRNVSIDSAENGGVPTRIRSGYGLFEKPDHFVLREAVNITTADERTPTTITAGQAVYEQNERTIDLTGTAEISQGNNYAKGDAIYAELYPSNKLRSSVIRGNGYIRQIEPDRTVEVSAAEMNASFADGHSLTSAKALNSASAILTPAKSDEYSKVTMSAPRSIALSFKQGGSLDQMLTDGRTTIQLDVPNNAPDSANKRLTADSVKTVFSADGKSIQRVEAVGDSELLVQPLRVSEENYSTTVNAPKFDCTFYPTGNSAKDCTAGKGTKTVRVPTVSSENRRVQTLTSETLNAFFGEGSRDVERLEAAGNAKFVELDRNGVANHISFTNSDKVVRLRGGEPTVWDSRARAKAQEIDWDTKNQRSALRNGVSTTYYSQKSTGGAAPFGDTNKPVFVTAANAEFDHRAESAVYFGNARGWQDRNYVRASKFTMQQKQGQFDAEGGVQSLLYEVKRKENGRESTVPVSAASGSMTFLRDTRLLRYVGSVDIRQGTDRITGEKADVHLSENNELAKTEIEKNVVIIQPKRKATGDFASYVADTEVVLLRGNPARVEDADQGISQAAQMTVHLRENRVTTEGRSTQNTAGRTRSVYKVREN